MRCGSLFLIIENTVPKNIALKLKIIHSISQTQGSPKQYPFKFQIRLIIRFKPINNKEAIKIDHLLRKILYCIVKVQQLSSQILYLKQCRTNMTIAIRMNRQISSRISKLKEHALYPQILENYFPKLSSLIDNNNAIRNKQAEIK
eukprot:TRINITY_DN14568_c0_g1_i1.p2 TRINITY_DN14568_c0_g1~~TRINITY_DN14568_c0_g1_i1.p2  ORF type:complete len:145 (+),score=5.57 TRINITY_DN14568_c0_g1_i1:2-436(+)